MSQITIQCRLLASESTRQQLWQLMAEKNTPLINELLSQIGKHPEFETWRQQGKHPTGIVKELCEPDFSLFKVSGIHFHPETQGLYDSGYQGIDQYHSNSYTPKKKPKNRELSLLEKDYNRVLAKARISIEHINRRLKIFKIFGDRYRNRRRRYGLRCNLLAAIYNYELSLAIPKSQTPTIT